MKILEPQFGDHFVGRDYEIQELKAKIRNNGVVVVTGDRGIGKTNLMREPSVLEYMEKSKDKIIFIENAQELKKEDRETIFAAAHRNDRLKFVLEIATPNFLDVKLTYGLNWTDQVVELKKLRDEDIEIIIGKECPNFPDAVVKKIIFLSKGYPYIARSLAYICDNKSTQEERLEFLETLKDENIKHTLDQIHKEVLETLGKAGQKVIKEMALAPPVFTSRLIEAFCGEDADAELSDILYRGILRNEKEVYWIYHPLFRDYLRNPKIQPIAVGKRKEIYRKAMEKVKSEFDSIYLLSEVLNEPDIFKDLIEIAENYDAINSIGIQCNTWGELKQASLAWSLILKRSGEAKDKKWESIALGNMGYIYRIKGELDKALEFFDKELKLNDELGSKEGMAKAFGNMGIVYGIKGELDKALEFCEKSLKLNEELGSKEGMARAFGNMGIIYRIKGELDKALEFCEKSLKLNEELGNKEGMAAMFGNMGNVYQTKDELDKALEYYEKSLKLEEELGRKEGMAADYGNMGNVYQIKGELDKALEYYEKSLKLEEELGSKQGTATAFGNMGNVYQTKGELDKALEYYEKSLKLEEELGSKEGTARAFGNMGNVYQIKGELEKALEFFDKALKIFEEEIGSKIETARTLMNIGSVFVRKGDKDHALDYYLEAQELVIDTPSLFWVINRKANELLGIS